MAESKHPYVPSKGILVRLITQLRQSYPTSVDASTLQKLGIGSNNESVLLHALRFLGLIDDDGKKTQAASKIFSTHDDAAFQRSLAKQVKASYAALFDLHGENAWDLDTPALISFFRNHDQTSALTGKRQATCFEALSALSGHGEVPTPRATAKRSTGSSPFAKKAPAKKKAPDIAPPKSAKARSQGNLGSDDGGETVGLTVRIEVNLPAGGDQATYDRIFKSIRENLLNG